MEAQALIEKIAAQRDQALNALAVAQVQIDDLTRRLAASEAAQKPARRAKRAGA